MPASPSGKILIVDDRPENLLAYETVLGDLGAEIVRAGSGEEALKRLLSDGGFAAIVLDVRMPGMGGLETARLIRSRAADRETPIILVTGHDFRPEEVSQVYSLGTVDLLGKPLNGDVLRAKVALFLELFERSRLALVFEGALDAVVVVGGQGVIRHWNPRAEAIFGWAREEMVGRPLTETIIPPQYRSEYLAGIERFRKTGVAPILGKRLELSALRRDGTEFPIELSVTRLPIPGEQRFCAFIRDITEEKRAALEIRKLNEELEGKVRDRTRSLEEALRELDTFAYTVAHDLRSPLRAMSSFSELLLEDHAPKLGDQGADLARRIARAAGRMDTLIQDLLAYSRLVRQDVPLGDVDLTAVLDRVLLEMKGEIALRQAKVEVERPLPRVRGHTVTLAQALANLLENAIKFAAPGARPQVRVRAERRGAGVRLWVEDQGIGIAEEHLGRLFRPFERLHRTESYPGTGIGLAIVRRALERMGGRAGVESELGHGSRFWIELDSA